MHPGQRNSLDALCKRYFVDNTKRDLHGALLDANLLAQVYLAMTGGQGSFFDGNTESQTSSPVNDNALTPTALHDHKLIVVYADAAETTAHENYLALLGKKAKCLWSEND
jgi:DNA polymerase-3 subunit epsilon